MFRRYVYIITDSSNNFKIRLFWFSKPIFCDFYISIESFSVVFFW